jgi:hypothetical protein
MIGTALEHFPVPTERSGMALTMMGTPLELCILFPSHLFLPRSPLCSAQRSRWRLRNTHVNVLFFQEELKRRQSEAEESQLNLEELGDPQRPSRQRPIRKPLKQYRDEKGSPKKYKPDSELQTNFDLELMSFLVNCNLHYSIIETKGFKQFLDIANPKYNIKSAQTMSKKISALLNKNLEEAMQLAFEKELPHCRNVAFTYREWTKNNIETFISPSIHYINQKFEFRNVNLGADNFLEPTIVRIAAAMNQRVDVLLGNYAS